MNVHQPSSRIFLCACLLAALGLAPQILRAQQTTTGGQAPEGVKGAKIYHLPENSETAKDLENPAIFKSLTYDDINGDRLVLNLAAALRPVNRSATVERIYFQDVQVGGVPMHVDSLNQEFKLSKTDPVDLPAPLKCSIVFSELDSLKALQSLVNMDKIRVTGMSFVELKLNTVEKVLLRSKRLVLPVKLNEEVPFQFLSSNPFVQMAAQKVLELLSDPTTSAAITMAKEHVARLSEEHALDAISQSSVYLVYCEYVLRSPDHQASEKFMATGTGFLISADGKLVTAKRVVQPWKFDAQIAFLISKYHLEQDPKGYFLAAWPAGSNLVTPGGKVDLLNAFTTEKQTLALLKTAPDEMEKHSYREEDSGETATLELHADGKNDLAVLKLTGSNFPPLAIADPSAPVASDKPAALLSYPFGLNQGHANPKTLFVKIQPEASEITVDHTLDPGESGAPLVTEDGKVLGVASGKSECTPWSEVRGLIP
jgi:S1-C subfamily serine protease